MELNFEACSLYEKYKNVKLFQQVFAKQFFFYQLIDVDSHKTTIITKQ